MSRYRIPAVHEHYVVELGYDPPLGTFFAQVSDNTPTSKDEQDESPLALWVGTDVHEITTVDALQEQIKDYARIPDDCAPLPGAGRAGHWFSSELRHGPRPDALGTPNVE